MSSKCPPLDEGDAEEAAVSKMSTGLLTIDLAAIAGNYEMLCAAASGAEVAAVVKADAYGCGAHLIAPMLYKKGCRTFFVATLSEAIDLRKVLPDARIFILDGLFPGCSPTYSRYRLMPVIGSLPMLHEWSRFCQSNSTFSACALHVDTGMNRLGLGTEELLHLFANKKQSLQGVDVKLLISHLACADDPGHEQNDRQLELFARLVQQAGDIPASLANSAGVFLGRQYHFDLVRPGIALYGGRAIKNKANPARPVISLSSPIIQVRTVKKGTGIGYGSSFVTRRQTRLATLPVGYADGYFRSLGTGNTTRESSAGQGAGVFIGEYEAPVAGRISMDLVTIDVTDIPADLARVGQKAELLGSHISIDDLADRAGTIGYEILTSLGHRFQRRYKEAG